MRAGRGSGGRAGGWQPEGCWLDPRLLLECRGIPEPRHLTLTAPDERAVALHGGHCHRFVNVCMNG